MVVFILHAVIFDMDGLMFDTERLAKEGWILFGQEHGIPITDEIIMSCIGVNAASLLKICNDCFGQGFPIEELRQSVGVYMRDSFDRDGMPIKKGLICLLDFLKEHGIPTAVASSSSQKTVSECLERAGLTERFSTLVCGDMVERSKPEPDIFLKAAEELGVLPEECVVLEDSRNGIKAAFAAGMFPIMVPDLIPSDVELVRLAYQIVSDLEQVIPILEKLLTK
jgi:HAD superfamily hydrolase (TIGR01509 family)